MNYNINLVSCTEFPSKEELKQVLSVVNPSKTATEDSPNKDTENATEERPRDPRLHSSKQLQKQTKDILDIVKPILEKAKKVGLWSKRRNPVIGFSCI